MALLRPPTVAAMFRSILVILLLNELQVTAADSNSRSTCYWPDGGVSSTDSPCNDEGSPTACCPAGSWCLSNGLCYVPGLPGAKAYERHSCTDRDWKDAACPNVCTDNLAAVDLESVNYCADLVNNFNGGDPWCCDSVSDCCDSLDNQNLDLGHERVAFASIRADGSVSTLTTRSVISTGKDEPVTVAGDPVGFSLSTSSSVITIPIGFTTTASTFSRTSSRTSSSASSTTVLHLSSLISPASAPSTTTESTTSASSTSGNLATATLAANTGSNSDSAIDRHLPTIMATTISVPLGLMAIALLSFLLYRYRKLHAGNTSAPRTGAAYPPDCIHYNDSRVFPKVELDTHSSAINELPAPHPASELEGTTSWTSLPSNRISVAPSTTRWSLVSSVRSPSEHYLAAAGVPPMAIGLQNVSQQRYSAGQDSLLASRPQEQQRLCRPPSGLLATSPQEQQRLSRPPSGLQPAMEVAEDEVSVAPKPSTTGIDEQQRLSRPPSGLFPTIEVDEDEISVAPKPNTADSEKQRASDA